MFDAVAGEAGVIRVDSPDDVVDTVELLLHIPELRGRRLAGLTLSGAFRGLLLDAAEENGLTFPPLAAATIERLNALLSAGAMVGNPVDGGFGILSSADTYRSCIEALDADPNIDVLLVQEELAREAGPGRAERWMLIAEEFAATRATKPIVYASFVSYGLTAHSRELRSRLPHIAILQESNRALRSIAKAARAFEVEALASSAGDSASLDVTLEPYCDPELGDVVMVRSRGGVAFVARPPTREKVNDALDRLRSGAGDL